jgi:hypothetical protein
MTGTGILFTYSPVYSREMLTSDDQIRRHQYTAEYQST